MMLKYPLTFLLLLVATAGGQTATPATPATPPVKRALPAETDNARTLPAPAVKRALPLEEPVAVPAKPLAPPISPAAKPAGSNTTNPPAAPELQPIRGALPLTGDEVDIPIKPEAPKVSANVKPQGEDAVRLQIFLDEAKFGPGVIDGKPGRFTELAVRSWNEVNGHPSEDWIAVMTAARKAVPNPFAVAVVPDWSKDWVNSEVPFTDRKKQAKLKRMSYRSVAELMSERYHTDVPYLAELNSEKKIYNLKARDSVIVPNVKAFRIEDIKGTAFPADEVMSQRHVVVDTRINQMRVFEAAPAALVVEEPPAAATTTAVAAAPAAPATGAPPEAAANRGLIASFPITPGKPKFIKLGTWEIRNCVELPVWRYDQQLLETGKRSSDALIIPPGPNSPVGVIWNGTSRPGIGLHGTSDPETIGRARSAGCIRLANWDAIRLPTLVRPGATVEIR